MAKVTVTTNNGEVVEVFHVADFGDLSKSVARGIFDIELSEAIARAKRIESEVTA